MARVVSTLVQVHVVQPATPAGWKHLVLRRSKSDTHYPELWQCITGTIHPDESAVAAAQRELAEETGLTAEQWWIVPMVGSFYDWREDAIVLLSTFGAVVAQNATVRLAEHTAYRWEVLAVATRLLAVPAQQEGATRFEQLLNNCVAMPHLSMLYRLTP